MAWLSSGRVTNPTANQVLIDTGQLVAGPKNFAVYAASTAAAAFELQWRDATDTTTTKSQIVAAGANGFTYSPPLLRDVEVAQNERFRVIQVANLTGSVSVSMDIPL